MFLLESYSTFPAAAPHKGKLDTARKVKYELESCGVHRPKTYPAKLSCHIIKGAFAIATSEMHPPVVSSLGARKSRRLLSSARKEELTLN